ncbi:unnamed protein product [Ascophyllum nodosum]
MSLSWSIRLAWSEASRIVKSVSRNITKERPGSSWRHKQGWMMV